MSRGTSGRTGIMPGLQVRVQRPSTRSTEAQVKKEIVLPPHLYDRIKANAGEHGGIGSGPFFINGCPNCAHGMAWGTEARCISAGGEPSAWNYRSDLGEEPELARYIKGYENDTAVLWPLPYRLAVWLARRRLPCNDGRHISFETWCRRLNVKRGVEASPVEAEKELAGAVN